MEKGQAKGKEQWTGEQGKGRAYIEIRVQDREGKGGKEPGAKATKEDDKGKGNKEGKEGAKEEKEAGWKKKIADYDEDEEYVVGPKGGLLYTSPSPRDS